MPAPIPPRGKATRLRCAPAYGPLYGRFAGACGSASTGWPAAAASITDAVPTAPTAAAEVARKVRRRRPLVSSPGFVTVSSSGGRPALRLAEALEDVGEKRRGDALPRIGHAKLHLAVHPADCDVDAAASRRELDGVREQVPRDLLEPIGISENHRGLRLARQADGDLLRGGRRLHRVHRRPRHGDEVDRALSHPELALRHPRVVEELLDHPRLRVDPAIDRLQRSGGDGFVRAAGGQDVDPARDRGQRAAQLVRQRRHELVLDPIRLFRTPAGLGLERQRPLPLLRGEMGLRPVLDRQQDPVLSALRVVQLARGEHHRAASHAREVVLEHVVVDGRPVRQHPLQRPAQVGAHPLAIAQLVKEPPLRPFRGRREELVEGPVRPLDAQVRVEDDEGLARRVDDRVRVRQRALQPVDVEEHDHRAVDLVLPGSIRPHLQQVEAPLAVGHLALSGLHRVDRLQNVGRERRRVEARAEVAERRPTSVWIRPNSFSRPA